jgi:hypothetical protein
VTEAVKNTPNTATNFSAAEIKEMTKNYLKTRKQSKKRPKKQQNRSAKWLN